MKLVKVKVFVEPWNEDLTEEDCADPNGFETEISITEEDVRDTCDYIGLNRDGTLHIDAVLSELLEVIDEKIEDKVPTEYDCDYSWELIGDSSNKLDEFAKPIIKECETEIIHGRYESFLPDWAEAEFVEEKNIDGMDYVYYRIPKNNIV